MAHDHRPTGTLGPETAILYILDSKFLRPLRVLHYSLFKHQTLQACPVVVITNDPVVAEDPFVRAMAHSVELVSDEQLKAFSAIKGDRIDAKLATDFAPKFTFLKLLMFKDRGFKRHVFIDADMILTQAVDDALLAGPGDAKAVREFGAGTFPKHSEKKPENFPEMAREYVREHAASALEPIRSINSGFLVLQGPAISDANFDKAIALAGDKSFPDEQSLTTTVLRECGADFLRLPIWYNARRRMFASLGQAYFDEVRSDIIVLHYTPGKPWKMKAEERKGYDDLWFQYEDEAIGWIASTFGIGEDSLPPSGP